MENVVYIVARQLMQSERIRLLELLTFSEDITFGDVRHCLRFTRVSNGQCFMIATGLREYMINCLSWYAIYGAYDR